MYTFWQQNLWFSNFKLILKFHYIFFHIGYYSLCHGKIFTRFLDSTFLLQKLNARSLIVYNTVRRQTFWTSLWTFLFIRSQTLNFTALELRNMYTYMRVIRTLFKINKNGYLSVGQIQYLFTSLSGVNIIPCQRQ